MSIYALLLLALSMSMDAFAVSVVKGAVRQMTLGQIVSTALVFGAIEACSPLIGWFFGSLAKQFVSEWDHWLAFVLLGVLGVKMIKEGRSEHGGEERTPVCKAKSGWGMTILTAVATSIDSMVVGVSLAFMDVNIGLAAAVIGLATTVMTAIGMAMGKTLGKLAGKRAEILGGVVLIVIGIVTLVSHLSAE